MAWSTPLGLAGRVLLHATDACMCGVATTHGTHGIRDIQSLGFVYARPPCVTRNMWREIKETYGGFSELDS